jgi:2-phospho-L-lactate/phosphoenolpyruvate guanylyltransferase
MTAQQEIWAIVPVKELAAAKQRLAASVPPALRPGFVLAMLEDVLEALAGASRLAGIAVVTVDPAAGRLARSYGARIIVDRARDGHRGAVAGAAARLRSEGIGGMLTVPGDIPAVTSAEIDEVLRCHLPAPAVTIVPAHDRRGSNALLVSPPNLIPFEFGDDSFLPHLAGARRAGVEAVQLTLAGIGLDIDSPADLARFLALGLRRRASAFLAGAALTPSGAENLRCVRPAPP